MYSEITLHCTEALAKQLAIGVAEEVCRWKGIEPDGIPNSIMQSWPRVSLGGQIRLLIEYDDSELWIARLWDKSFARRIKRKIGEVCVLDIGSKRV